MRKQDQIPAPAVKRLSLYLRQLELLVMSDRRTVSSRQLGEALSLSDAQVRKDLAYFGQFGHPGIGYRVEELAVRIRRILGTDKNWNVALVGSGNLGRALLSYRGFAKRGFHVVAVFDGNEKLVGMEADGEQRLVIEPMDKLPQLVKKRNIQLGILAVPAEDAQSVADQMVAAGVKGILNFAPVSLRTGNVVLAAVDLSVHLEQLSFRLGGGSP